VMRALPLGTMFDFCSFSILITNFFQLDDLFRLIYSFSCQGKVASS
jgi:hypothetical protein